MSQQGDTGSGFITGVTPAAPRYADPPGQPQGTPPTVVIQGAPVQGWQPTPGVRYFTEDEVGAIRTEEKEKLYSRITSVEEQLAQAQAEREARETEIAEAQARAAEAERLRQEQEMDVRQLLDKRDQEWNQRFTTVEQERERDRAIYDQERRFLEVDRYRLAMMDRNRENILPELLDLIEGTTEEEVDRSIDILTQRTAAILGSIQQAVTTQRGPIRGVSPTGAPPMGPTDTLTNTETLTEAQIRAMDPEEYKRYREPLLRIARQAGQQQPR